MAFDVVRPSWSSSAAPAGLISVRPCAPTKRSVRLHVLSESVMSEGVVVSEGVVSEGVVSEGVVSEGVVSEGVR